MNPDLSESSNSLNYNFYEIKLVSCQNFTGRTGKKLCLASFLDLLRYKRFMLDSSTFIALQLHNLTVITASL